MVIATSSGQVYEDEYNYTLDRPMPDEAPVKITVTKEKPDEEAPPVDTSGVTFEDFKTAIGSDMSRLWEGIKHAVKLGPALLQDVATGKLDPNSDEALKKIHEVTMNFGIAGLMTAPMKPGVGMFGGRMTKTAVRQAEKMETEGFSASTVKELTGLERGSEGMWRKEFSDAPATINAKGLTFRDAPDLKEPGKFIRVGEGTLDDVLKHDKLFQVYPEAREIRIVTTPKLRQQGMFDGADNTIWINSNLSPETARNVILHEVQHWIQKQEGFAYGNPQGLPDDLKKTYRQYLLAKYGEKDLKELAALKAEGKTEEAKVLAAKIAKEIDHIMYRNSAHEQEAWNVELRSHMTETDISRTLGKATETQPRSEHLIVDSKSRDAYLGSEHSIAEGTSKVKHYEIYDLKEKKVVGGPYKIDPSQRRRGRTRADKLNLEYGAHRYTLRPVYEDGLPGYGY